MQPLFRGLLAGIAFLLFATGALAEEGLSRQIQNLKMGVLELNRELTRLERELLWPSSEVAVFVSVDVGSPVRLVDVNLTLDGEHVGYHYYSDPEFEALTKGGIHRLFDGHVTSGRHVLEATITGYSQGKDYQKSTRYEFVKGAGRKMIELKAGDDHASGRHEFRFREWNE